MKKYFICLTTLFSFILTSHAQNHNHFEIPLSINGNGLAPDSSAILDIQSNHKGLLIPRMTSANRASIKDPSKGLLIYQLGSSPEFYYFNGIKWRSFRAYSVGDYAHGGIVFWVDPSGQHGLVCALEDIDPKRVWSFENNTRVMSKGNGPYAGDMNTKLIVSSLADNNGGNYAARLCSEFTVTLGGVTYHDWYLPSISELAIILANREIINAALKDRGGDQFFSGALGVQYYHWTSNEYDDDSAYAFNFWYGDSTKRKFREYNVRAVRAF